MDLLRRRIIATGVALFAGGLAGCSDFFDDDDDTGPADSDSESVMHVGPDDTGGPEDPADEMGEIEVLTFSDDVSPAVEQRSKRALARTRHLMADDITDGEVSIDVINVDPNSFDYSMSTFQERVSLATHRELPPTPFDGMFGRYRPNSRHIWVFHQDVVETVAETHNEDIPVDTDTLSFDGFPDGPILANLLAHAIQFDKVTVRRGGPEQDNWEGGQSLIEGTGEYIAGRYRAECSDDIYDPCEFLQFWISAPQTPLWGIHKRLPFINGMVLTHYILEKGGWDALWESHEPTPNTAWAAMFPQQYLEDGIGIQSVSQTDPGDEWEKEEDDRLGVTYLYEKLAYLDQVSPSDEEGQVNQDLQETAHVSKMFRTTLLEGWRGDNFRFYETSDGREAYTWKIAFETDDGAAEFAAAIEAGYDDRGTKTDQGWKLVEGTATVEQSETTVLLSQAPTTEDLETLLQISE